MSQPGVLRLQAMPALTVCSAFSNVSPIRLRSARFSAEWPVRRRKPVAASAAHGGNEEGTSGRSRRIESAHLRPRPVRHDDPGQPPQVRHSGTRQDRAAEGRLAGTVRRQMDSRGWRVHRLDRRSEACRRLHRPRTRHRRSRTRQRSRQGNGQRPRLRSALHPGLRLRPARQSGNQKLRQAQCADLPNESRPEHGRRAAEENRRGEPVHGLRRTGY